MARGLAIGGLLLTLLAGCAPQPAAAPGGSTLADPRVRTNAAENPSPASSAAANPAPQSPLPLAATTTVATVNGKPITLEQLYHPLAESHGLDVLLYMAQLELCRQKAEAAKIDVTPQDIAAERQRMLEQMFAETIPDDDKMSPEELKAFKQKEYDRLLEQFLQVKRLSRAEFDLVITANAYLRKLAEPGIREQIKEEHLQEGFKILYGEKVQVRHIQLKRMQEVPEVQRRLAAGESFEQVAREMSIDEKSRAAGGMLRPFSRAEPMWPDAFKDAAFALKEPKEISGPVSDGESIHLIQLIAKFPPNPAVKYETHKEYVRERIYDGLLQARIGQLREQLRIEAPRALRIEDPAMKKQYSDRLAKAAGETSRDPNQVRREIEMDHRKPAATRPAADAALPAQPEGLRPPATRPAEKAGV